MISDLVPMDAVTAGGLVLTASGFEQPRMLCNHAIAYLGDR
jgi:hypothetical protein